MKQKGNRTDRLNAELQKEIYEVIAKSVDNIEDL